MASSNSDGTICSIPLPERLDYAACAALHDQLCAAEDQGLRLEADKVAFVGGLAAELLLRAAQARKDHGLSCDVVAAGEGFSRGIALLGLTESDFSAGAQA